MYVNIQKSSKELFVMVGYFHSVSFDGLKNVEK